MTTVTVGVSDLGDVKNRVRRAFDGETVGAHLSFASLDHLWATLTPRRWAVLRAMTGAGPVTLRGLSRTMSRDVKSIHADVHALLDAGVVERSEDGRFVFPFDAIHVDFTVRTAA